MHLVLFLSFLVAFVQCSGFFHSPMSLPHPSLKLDRDAITDELLDAIHTCPLVSWRGERNKYFEKKTLGSAATLCGTFVQGGPTIGINPPFLEYNFPNSFDWREKAGNMCPTLLKIADQGNCGSCWAFGSVGAMMDRLCIQSNGSIAVELSIQDAVSCCPTYCGMGCKGGYPGSTWEYFYKTGIVTGEIKPQQEPSLCFSYKMNKFESPAKKYNKEEIVTPKCPYACENPSLEWSKGKYFADGHPYHVIGKCEWFGIEGGFSCDVRDIQQEIYTNGPISATFLVHEDFLTYTAGIYSHITGHPLGGHTVKIIGWGEENRQHYWLAANSWSEDWGENGFFKIRRGVNECGIEYGLNGGPVAGKVFIPKI